MDDRGSVIAQVILEAAELDDRGEFDSEQAMIDWAMAQLDKRLQQEDA